MKSTWRIVCAAIYAAQRRLRKTAHRRDEAWRSHFAKRCPMSCTLAAWRRPCSSCSLRESALAMFTCRVSQSELYKELMPANIASRTLELFAICTCCGQKLHDACRFLLQRAFAVFQQHLGRGGRRGLGAPRFTAGGAQRRYGPESDKAPLDYMTSRRESAIEEGGMGRLSPSNCKFDEISGTPPADAAEPGSLRGGAAGADGLPAAAGPGRACGASPDVGRGQTAPSCVDQRPPGSGCPWGVQGEADWDGGGFAARDEGDSRGRPAGARSSWPETSPSASRSTWACSTASRAGRTRKTPWRHAARWPGAGACRNPPAISPRTGSAR